MEKTANISEYVIEQVGTLEGGYELVKIPKGLFPTLADIIKLQQYYRDNEERKKSEGEPGELTTIEDFAKLSKMHPDTVRRKFRDGVFGDAAIKNGNKILLYKNDALKKLGYNPDNYFLRSDNSCA